MKIIKKLFDSFLVKRKPPLNLTPGDEVYFGGPAFQYLVPASNLYYLRNAVVTSDGFIIQRGKARKEFIICYDTDFKSYAWRYVLRVFLKYRKTPMDQQPKYMMVFDNYSGPGGFSHWLSDGLTRLVALNDLLPEYTVLLPYYFREEKLYPETLKYFNIRHSFYIPKHAYVRVRNLYVADQIADTGDYLPENVRTLRQFIWEKSGVSKKTGLGDRIYISRARATRRFVTNEEEVSRRLAQLGFTIVYMEEHSFEKQVEIVYHAKCVVSIHGAALTLIHFMQTGSNVLEFRMEKDPVNAMFFSLSDALGINYYYQFCPAVRISDRANNFNLTVDMDALNRNLEKILF